MVVHWMSERDEVPAAQLGKLGLQPAGIVTVARLVRRSDA